MHRPHKLALIFPPMDAEQYDDLKRDIAAHGLADPITLHEGKVLDGVHRERACNETGQSPAYVDFDGTDPMAFVISRNLQRRHLTVGQRADLALKLLPRYETEAKGRQGARTDILTDPSEGSVRAVDRAAEAVGLGATTVSTAKRVKREDPDLWKDVVAGKTSVDAADRKVRKGKGEQPAPKNRGDRKENWNGKTNAKRQRELKDRQREGNYVQLLRLQLDITKMCRILEDWKPEDYASDVETTWLVADIHDDLITLGEWHDRTLSSVQGWLLDVDVREKIAKLRDTKGRTAEEAETALRLADRLERKLEARLTQ